MKQKITFLLLAVFTTVLSAQTVSIEGGSSYGTITEAITAAVDGDVILISGIHTESISIGESITLKGADPATDIIQAAASSSTDGTGNRVINISRAEDTDILNITIENLGIRNGNASSTDNGGGINVDKVTGLLTLKNLIIEDNYTAKNGGGLSIAGSNVDLIECTIKNNTSSLDGGGMIAVPNNGAGINNIVNIEQSLIDSNTGRNGGGIYVNGNNGYGNNFTIDLNVENGTVSNNNATSGSSGAGGGAVWCKVAQHIGASTGVGNINLKFVHATLYNNSHSALAKSGLRFTGTAGVTTNLSAYNSILVSFGDDTATKSINFTSANLTNMVNCILGGLEAAATANTIIDNAAKNNLKGKTATFAGLTGALTNEGGNTQVIAITDGSNADDYCTAATGITIPAIDQRGYDREGTNDAGAYEVGGTLGLGDVIIDASLYKIYPNPAKDFIRVQGIDSIDEIKIYSVLGSLEKTIYNNDHINISDLSSGVYIVVVKGDDKIGSNRLIVK